MPSSVVTVGGTNCGSLQFISANSITCTLPPNGEGKLDVKVINQDGRSAIMRYVIEYMPKPILLGMSITHGTQLGGDTINITGFNFANGIQISIGGSNCTTSTFIDENHISCITPIKTTGIYDLVMINPDTQSTTVKNAFTYDPAPIVSGITPSGGRSIGQNMTVVTGLNFVNGANVKIGTTPCITVEYISNTQLKCKIPPQYTGSFDVEVVNPDLQSGKLISGYIYNPPLSISSRTPAYGKKSGGDLITVTGGGFIEGTTVTINGISCPSINIINLNRMTFLAPASSSFGTYDIVVNSPDGSSVILSGAYGYTYSPPPTLTSIQPSNGKITSGTTLTLTGTGFLGGVTASIDGLACTSPNLVSSTTLTCIAPAHSPGTVNVQVMNGDSQSFTLPTSYTYNPVPTLNSINPTSGVLAGGSTLTISGTGFISGATVSIGGITCASPTVISSTSMTCVVPTNTAGTKNVVITNPDSQNVTLANSYTYNPFPTISAITPNNGKLAGGTTITLTGSGFITGATVTIGGSACTSSNVSSSTSMTCITPAKSAGSYNLLLTNPDTQSVTVASGFTYNEFPTITSISPNNGLLAGGNKLTITGTGFLSGVTVTIGGTSCTSPTALNSTTVTCNLPAKNVGTYNIVVTNSDTQSTTLANGYTYNPLPTINSISPTNGKLAGGDTLTITGTGFIPRATVAVGGITCTSPTVTSSTSLICTLPASSAGPKTVVVSNPDNQSVSASTSYTYNAIPTITTISPNIALSSGGDVVNLTGTGFMIGATVTIGDHFCASTTVHSSTSISCTTAATLAGNYSVTVTNADTQSGTLANSFAFNDFDLFSVSPNNGPQSGGGTLTISGSGFVAGATVTVGGSACTSPNVNSSSSMTCILPAKIDGIYDVVVMNANATFSTLISSFTYNTFPTVTTVSPTSGKLAGGSTLTISGTGFINGATVTIGGNTCASPVFISSTSMSCQLPGNIAGSYSVVVTNPDTQSGIKVGAYTYNAVPTITSVTPSTGKALGGTMVTITGTGFIAGATVSIGGSTCTAPNVNNSTFMTCAAPALSTDTFYSLTLMNTDTQTATKTNAYSTIASPNVTSVSPNSGSMAGGTTITLSGTNFISGATVTIGGSNCTSPTVINSTSITCNTPAHAIGLNSIVVTNPDTQSNTLANAYMFTTFPLMFVTPSNGKLSGGTSISIAGNNFVSGATVLIGTGGTFTTCTSPVVVNSSTITCNTPAKSAGIYSILVNNGNGESASLDNSFTYNPIPTITSVNPSGGSPSGGTTITINGTGFLTGASVKVGGSTCTTPTIISATSMTCVTPAHAAGTVSVAITNPDTQSVTRSNSFTYNDGPTIASVTPTSGTKKGGTIITLSGSGFLANATVTVGGSNCTSVSVAANGLSLTCVTPAGTIGNATINLTNTDSQSTSLSGFTYIDATDASKSTLKVSASMAPSDGIASVQIFCVPKNDAGVLRGSGRTVEVFVTSPNVTLSGGTTCSSPSSTCKRATEVATGVYSVTAKASASVSTATFSAIVRETPDITITQTAIVNFNTGNFSVISSNSTITSSNAGMNLYFTGGTSTFDASTVGVQFGHLFAKNATLQHLPSTHSQVNRLDVRVSSLNLMTGASINVSGLGYLSGSIGTNGNSVSGDSYGSYSLPSQENSSLALAGASHGGKGGYSSYGSMTDSGATYDDFTNPNHPGGGAFGVGSTYAGGGVARITATEYCSIYSGSSIKANASALYGTAGGSIYLNCSGFAGSADQTSISANGGGAVDWTISGGGGGLIALVSSGDQSSFVDNFNYPQGSTSLSAIKNVFSAKGGNGINANFPAGGAGILYLKHSAATYGDVIIDNGKSSLVNNDGYTDFPITSGYHFNRLDIAGYSKVNLNANLTLDECDLHSAEASTFNVPTGSVLIGNDFTSSFCLNSSVTTKGTTVQFNQYFLK